MARPKAGTEKGNAAAAKWRKTMRKKYGTDDAVRSVLQQIGRIGGERGHTGGFYANPAKARVAGSLGGRISRRGGGSVLEQKVKPQAREIEKLYSEGYSIPQIAKKLDLSYGVLLRWAKEELVGYGTKDDIEYCEKVLEHERGRNKGVA